MATLITGNGNGKYHDSSALHDVITYVLNTRKAPNYEINIQITMGVMITLIGEPFTHFRINQLRFV